MDQNLNRLTIKKRKFDLLRPVNRQVFDRLEEWLKVELTYSSNAIEGNTLTRLETAEGLEKGISAVLLEAVMHFRA